MAATPLHFGTTAAGGARLGWYHPPAGPPRAGVVVCNPIGDDDVRAHRALRHLADALAAAGFAALRFDFWGTGDSRGDERAPDLVARWRDDIGLAVGELRARSGAAAIAVVGLRLGATLAALAASARDDIASLVAWSPYETGDAFVADATRTDQMRRALEPQSFLCEPDDWQPGGEQASGFLLTPPTIAALRELDLGRLPRMAARTLVIGTGNVSGDDRLRARLTALGVAPAHRHLPGFRFLTTAPQKSEVPRPVLDAIVQWLSAQHPPVTGGAVRTAAAPPVLAVAVGDDVTEQPLVFGADRPRFGIVARAAERLRGQRRPAIVMLSSGCTHRVGPHRMYVTFARRWAQLGFDVLRMDLSGIGDSPAAPGCAENLSYPQGGVADVQAAIDALGQLGGARSVVLFGHNSGADFAFLTALRDTRVVGAILVNPRTFGVYDFDTVTSYQRARYVQSSLLRAASWKKAFAGRVDFGRAIATITPKLVDVVRHRAAALLGRRGAGDDHDADVPGGIRTLTERGVDTLLLATENDPGIDFVDSRFGRTMADLGRLSGYTREELRGTDHTFTSRFAQDTVSQLLTDHLSTRYVARVG